MKNQLGYHVEKDQKFEKVNNEFSIDALNAELASINQLRIEQNVITEIERLKYSIQTKPTANLNINSTFFNTLDEILKIAIRVFGGKLMIAGGAVRDTLLNKPVKDIDIFIYDDDIDADELLKDLALFDKLCHSTTDYDSTDKIVYGDSDQMTRLVDVSATKWGIPIQLVFVKDLNKHFDTFSVNLSKVKYSVEGLTMTREFINDFMLKQLTVNSPVKPDYVDKISKKYSDYVVNTTQKLLST